VRNTRPDVAQRIRHDYDLLTANIQQNRRFEYQYSLSNESLAIDAQVKMPREAI
jgi:hypothetical protein